MIDIQPFIDELTGKYVEFSGGGAALDECVDLVNEWRHRNGLAPILHTNAIDFQKLPGFVKNTKSYLPPIGATAIYKVGQYGHVDLVAPGTTLNNLVAFAQNWPVGSPCRLVTHRLYASCIGFLVEDSKPTTYKVAKGDTLSKIATAHGTTFQVLAKINNLFYPYIIYPGQVLRLP